MFAARHLAYDQTHCFTPIILDYLKGAAALQPFYSAPPGYPALEEAVRQRKGIATDRTTLVQVLKEQYGSVPVREEVSRQIESLLSPATFTVTTAHQPNLFTGPLYFIYKILHVVRLSEELNRRYPDQHFVPVYYMGSEDADLAELNHFQVDGKRYEWKTGQKGAVGRMVIDKPLTALIDELQQQIGVLPHGKAFTELLRSCYRTGSTIQQATFELVHALFGAFGLVVLIPDHPELKRQMKTVFTDDLFAQTPSRIVAATSDKLQASYKVQAHPREINLFYLKGDIRERIVASGDRFAVNNTDLTFTEEELKEELDRHPERFSPNVILRGLLQETVLPNLAFIGGGGELAYWLQLKDLFAHYGVPFPLLVLRNSFLIVERPMQELGEKLGLSDADLFCDELQLMNTYLGRQGKQPALNGELDRLQLVYEDLKRLAGSVDRSLAQHVDALKTRTVKGLTELEKKMQRAERRKHEAVQRQIARLRGGLFPKGKLQERAENLAGYYAKWGPDFISQLYTHSLTLEQQFCILGEQ